MILKYDNFLNFGPYAYLFKLVMLTKNYLLVKTSNWYKSDEF